MDSKRLLIAGGLLLFCLLIFGCSSLPSSTAREVVLHGEVMRSKGCFSVDGVVDCENKGLSFEHLGKLLEVTGVIGKYPCPDSNSQCYLGDAFTEVASVRVIDYNFISQSFSKIDYSKENPIYAYNQTYTGPTVCNRTLVSFGDLNFGNGDLNSVFILPLTGGAVIHFDMAPSICDCGKVSNLAIDVFVPEKSGLDDTVHSKILRSVEISSEFNGVCAN
jgi:hypothetical protein